MKNILVIGSVNMDMVINTPVLPKLGETLMGSGFMTSGGGKGANQATAIAKINGKDIDYAVKFASLASSITVARRGAAMSIPTMDEILAKKDSAWHD